MAWSLCFLLHLHYDHILSHVDLITDENEEQRSKHLCWQQRRICPTGEIACGAEYLGVFHADGIDGVVFANAGQSIGYATANHKDHTTYNNRKGCPGE